MSSNPVGPSIQRFTEVDVDNSIYALGHPGSFRRDVQQVQGRLIRPAHVPLQPMQALVDRARAPTRFALVLIGIFATIAVVLAAVGLYGVLSTTVRQRTSEIGVRMAFGADRGTILRLIVGQGLKLSVVGVGLGVVAAIGLTRIMASMLVGVGATDPLTFAAMTVLFLALATVACWVPARRAARLDPNEALRDE